MKHLCKRIGALLLALTLVLGLLPASVLAAAPAPQAAEAAEAPQAAETQAVQSPQEETEHSFGYIPNTVAGSRALTNAYLRGEAEQVNYFHPGEPAQSLPAAYDSRDYGCITAVGNQNPYGTCWSFGTIAPIEAYMIKHGIINAETGAPAARTMNLSELHLAWFNYTYAYDQLGMLTGDRSQATYGNYLDQGGNGAMATLTMMRWTGPASESVPALAYSAASGSGVHAQYAINYDVAHVESSQWILTKNRDAVKQAIMEYGAGTITYYHSDSYFNTSTSAYCFKQSAEYGSYYYQYGNHAVTVVGWDDNYSRTNFSAVSRPSSDGAWIVKNSWGTGWGDQGYFYLSYEDTACLNEEAFFYTVGPLDNYEYNYQYDGTSNVAVYQGLHNGGQIANVFTANGPETLKAVAVNTWDEAVTYTLSIYKNPTNPRNPTSGTLVATQDGYLPFYGYFTLPLEEPVVLAAGDKFAVVFTMSCPEPDPEDGLYVHPPYDCTYAIDWASWTHVNHGDTSFYRDNGGSWTDCPDNGDFRIKAYTDSIPFNLEAQSNNEAWGTVTVEDYRIICHPAEGYYAASCEVLSGQATATVDLNVVTVTPASDCVIRVNFAPKPTFNVSYVVSGVLSGSLSAQIYDVLTLPATVDVDPEGWTFSGWTTSQFEETTETPVLYAPGSEYIVRDNVILYACFTRVEEGAGGIIYQLADQLENGGEYILLGANSINGSSASAVGNTAITSGHYLTPVAVTLHDDDTCTASNTNLPKVLWKAAGSNSSGYTLYNEAAGKYMGLDSTEYLAPTASGTRWYYTAEGCLDNRVDSSGYYYLAYTESGTIRYTTSQSGTRINLYQKLNPDVIYYWTDPVAGEHDHVLTHFAAVAPTCVLAGNIEYWRCSICGKYFSDANAQHEVSADAVVLNATGHTPGQPVTENQTTPNCGQDGGYDTVTYCTACHAELSRVHTTLPATGSHSFGDWTANGNGTHSRTCAVCHQTETEACALSQQVVEPTPEDQGYTLHTCAVCGYSYSDSFVPALGYDYTVRFAVPAGVDQPADLISNTNTGITLPVVTGPEGYFFAGWVTDHYSFTEEAPAQILNGHYVATQDITLHALFRYYTDYTLTFRLLTQAPVDWQGRYVISYGAEAAYVMKGLSAGTSYEDKTKGGAVALSATGMRVNGNTLENVTDAYLFAFEAQGEALTVRSLGVGSYLTIQNSTLKAGAYDEATCLWAAAIAANGVVTLRNQGAPNNRSVLSFTTGTALGTYFRAYSSANKIRLWKEEVEGTPLYTTVISFAHDHQPGQPVRENEVPATCTDPGSYDLAVYCTLCHEELSRETVTLEALGHDWGEAAYQWAETPAGWSCTASAVCGRDSAHVLTETVAARYEEATPATDIEPGVGLWTAAFSAACFTDQVKEVTLAPSDPVVVTILPGEADGVPVPGEAIYYSSADPNLWSESAASGHFYRVNGEAYFDLAQNPYQAPEGYSFIGWRRESGDQTLMSIVAINAETTTVVAQWGKTYSIARGNVEDDVVLQCQKTAGEGDNVILFIWLPDEAWQHGWRMERLILTAPDGTVLEEIKTTLERPMLEYEAYLQESTGLRAYVNSFTMPASDVLISTVFLTPETHDCSISHFVDVMEAYPYGVGTHFAIEWAYDNGITAGMDATHFGVGQTLTRAQAATFLYAAAGKPDFDVAAAENHFTDVPAGKWYTKAVLWAAAQGYFAGYSDGSFRPNVTLTRGQIMVVLYAKAGRPDMGNGAIYFTDVPLNAWYTNAARWAYATRIEMGSQRQFAQSTPCTRECFVRYLYHYDLVIEE